MQAKVVLLMQVISTITNLGQKSKETSGPVIIAGNQLQLFLEYSASRRRLQWAISPYMLACYEFWAPPFSLLNLSARFGVILGDVHYSAAHCLLLMATLTIKKTLVLNKIAVPEYTQCIADSKWYLRQGGMSLIQKGPSTICISSCPFFPWYGTYVVVCSMLLSLVQCIKELCDIAMGCK